MSLPHHPLMYSQKHGSNLPYPATASAWYSNYPSHHISHHPNNQFLNAAPTSLGAGPNGILDTDPAAFYNAHHHMLHPASPDWGPDNYNLPTANTQFFANGMTPPTSLHLSPTINSHHSSNSANANADNLQNGLQNVPPSPPITVNSVCSDAMSSPGIGSNGNGGVMGSGDTSPSMTSNNNIGRPKSPYEWMKKASYQTQPNSGTSGSFETISFFFFFKHIFFKNKSI